jgi:hypothetical protein
VLPYVNTEDLFPGRWLAYYWGGRDPEQTVILCRYLARPSDEPLVPESRKEARRVVQALSAAWDDCRKNSQQPGIKWLQEDIAKYLSLVILDPKSRRRWDWTAEDLELLQQVKASLEDSNNKIGRGYISGIQQVIDPFIIWPPPWVRSLLAFACVNVAVVLLFLLASRAGGVWRWLPFLAYAIAPLGITVVDLRAFTDQVFATNVWLLGGLLLGEFIVLLASGTVSARMLRYLAQVEPIRRVAVPLAFVLPPARRKFFRGYVARLRQMITARRERALGEHYLTVSAEIRTEKQQGNQADPADRVFQHLMESSNEPCGGVPQGKWTAR